MAKEKDFFADQILHKFYSHPDVLANFELLQSIGVMDFFELLITTYKDLELLHQKATYIFMQDDLDSLYSFITEVILQKFIPSYLLFVVRRDRFSEFPMVNCFKNLKRVDSPIHVEDLTPYVRFFENNNQMLVFENDLEFSKADPVFADLANFSPRLLIPIMGKGSFYGFVLVGKKLLDEAYSETEQNFIQTIVQFAAIAIQNIINHRWAVTDAKTGLFCFNFFKDRIVQELSRTSRHNHETALFIIDIDHFKEFNDNHGHQAGDAMILVFSNLLKKETRVDDILCRFGGDEFMILLTETDLAGISSFAQRLMKSLSEVCFDLEGKRIPPISVSIGIAVYQHDSRIDADELIKRADKALYYSKQNGRNRMTFWGPNQLFVSKPGPHLKSIVTQGKKIISSNASSQRNVSFSGMTQPTLPLPKVESSTVDSTIFSSPQESLSSLSPQLSSSCLSVLQRQSTSDAISCGQINSACQTAPKRQGILAKASLFFAQQEN